MKEKKVSTDEIWPQERDVIYRPDRLKYVRKIKKPQDCVFAKWMIAKPIAPII